MWVYLLLPRTARLEVPVEAEETLLFREQWVQAWSGKLDCVDGARGAVARGLLDEVPRVWQPFRRT